MATIMEAFIVVAALTTLVHALPPPLPSELENFRIIPRDWQPIPESPVTQHISALRGFRYVYIDQRGNQFPSNRGGVLEIAASPRTSAAGFSKTIYIVKKMVQHMPPAVFARLTANGRVGVFTKEETLAVFPEYAHMRDRPECRGICSGACQPTCTGDGRKWSTVAGAGGARGVGLEDNVLCNSRDPYGRSMNVMVHEFAHTIHQYSLSAYWKQQIRSAWYNARMQRKWNVGSYAMSNDLEYFAEAAGVFLHTNKYVQSNGGMSNCFNRGTCRSEYEARRWLYERDNAIYNILTYVFTNNSGAYSNLRICV